MAGPFGWVEPTLRTCPSLAKILYVCLHDTYSHIALNGVFFCSDRAWPLPPAAENVPMRLFPEGNRYHGHNCPEFSCFLRFEIETDLGSTGFASVSLQIAAAPYQFRTFF